MSFCCLGRLIIAVNKIDANIKYASLKHTTSCVVSFETTGWYECCQTDYNANVDFDINRKCLVEPTGCQIIKSNGTVCGRIVTHTHTNPDGSNHTFTSDWNFDEYNHQFIHNQ